MSNKTFTFKKFRIPNQIEIIDFSFYKTGYLIETYENYDILITINEYYDLIWDYRWYGSEDFFAKEENEVTIDDLEKFFQGKKFKYELSFLMKRGYFIWEK